MSGRRLSCTMAVVLAVTGCSAQEAEVGADPRDAALTSSDGSTKGDRGSDGLSEGSSGQCDPQSPIRLYAWNLRTAASSTDINFIIKIENRTGSPIDASSLEARYYFTNELSPPWAIDVFYADTCCSNKKTDFKDSVVTSVDAIAAEPSADATLRIAFGPTVGPLANGDAIQVEIAFHDVGYARTVTQSNDYSFAALAAGTQSEWDSCPGLQCQDKFTTCAMTVYRDGILAWGTPP